MSFTQLDSVLLQHQNKIIHQIWFNLGAGDKPNNTEYTQTWKNKNSDHHYHLWSEDQALNLIKEKYPFFLNYYLKYPHGIQRIDAVRYFILHRYGGWYVDIDVECLKPIKDIRERYSRSLYLVESPTSIFGYRQLNNCLIYSNANHAFWPLVHKELIDVCDHAYIKGTYNIKYKIRGLDVLYTTGPFIITKVFDKYDKVLDIHRLPYIQFNPCGVCDDNCTYDKNQLFTLHRNFNSWYDRKMSCGAFMQCKWDLIIAIIVLIVAILLLIYLYNKKY